MITNNLGKRPAQLILRGVFTLCEASVTGCWLAWRKKPDITRRALAAELADRGIKVNYFAVWHFFEHEWISFKKSLHASEQDRPDVARRRAQWKRYRAQA
jgi:hypothetical protein